MARVLGIDPRQMQPAKRKAPPAVDLRKPLSQQTADQVVQSLSGRGPARPDPSRPTSVQAPERFALVAVYSPGRPQPPSAKEVKLFLSSRKESRPGTVQLFLVLHETSG
jgi:hypothetical protein